MSKSCHLVCDTPTGIQTCKLTLSDEADIAAAIEQARRQLGEAAAAWQTATTGVFGTIRDRTHVPADGDRIELYRPLLIDPRLARRERAAKTRRQKGNSSGQ